MRFQITVLFLFLNLCASIGQNNPIDPHRVNDDPHITNKIESNENPNGFSDNLDVFEVNPNNHFSLNSETEGLIVLRWTPTNNDSLNDIITTFYSNMNDSLTYELYIDGYQLFIDKIKPSKSIQLQKSFVQVETSTGVATTLVSLLLLSLVLNFSLNKKFKTLREILKKELDKLDSLLPNQKGNKSGKAHNKMQLGYWKNCAIQTRKSVDELKKYL